MNTPFSSGRLLSCVATLLLFGTLAACDAADPLGSDAGLPADAVSLDEAAVDDLEAALLAAPVTMTQAGLDAALASSSAADVTCTGTIGATSIDGNVIVPDGARCNLNRTRVDGNVIVGTGSILVARGVEVGGNVQAEGAEGVLLRDDRGTRSTVGGSVQLNQGDQAGVIKTTVDSDVQVEQNDGRIVLNQNRVDGNMQVNQNTGGVSINRNTIQGALQCQSNNPPPTGGGNQAGDKEDQCENL